nr:MAG TPA: hypothetical protein [Caudoviricetes sp.]
MIVLSQVYLNNTRVAIGEGFDSPLREWGK